MALFGAQLVFSMIMASLLQRIMPFYSIGRWLLCRGLVRYLHPTDEELKTAAGVPHNTRKQHLRNRRGNKEELNGTPKPEAFTVPKNLDFQLEPAEVTPIDVIHLHYYSDYQWLLDFSFCAGTLYIITEIYYALFQPRAEINLSMLWCLLVVMFCIKVLFSLTAAYFRTEDGSERIMCVVFGFFFFVAAMGILIVDEDILEFSLIPAYGNFSSHAEDFLNNQGISSSGPPSLNSFRITLAVISAINGALLTFPGLRYAKMYTDALKYSSAGTKVLLHINFLLPLLVVLCWYKPLMRDYLTGVKGQKPLLTDEGFESSRLWLILVTCASRLLLAPQHFQAYLNIAQERTEALKKEAGRISNVDLQRTIARVFYYLAAAALQYLAPIILLLFLTFCFKTLSNSSWLHGTDFSLLARDVNSTTNKTMSHVPESIAETAAQFTLALSSLARVFTPTVFKGVLSYITWWICAAWSATSLFGVMYYSYFIQ